jgi:excisionase family DNA binding protein
MAVERLAYRPAEAAEALGISRSKLYELLAASDPSVRLPSFKLGHSIRIPADALREWLAKRANAA